MKIIGHRGAKGLAPENTLRSFEKALEHHVDEIELDVRNTRDGQAILAHDRFVRQADGEKLDILVHDLAELKKHKPTLTTLEEALRGVGRRSPVYVEVKPAVSTEPTIRVINQLLGEGWQNSDFRLGSYSQEVLLELHRALPGIQTIVIENWSGVRAARRARALGTTRISMLEYWLWPGFIRAMKRRGIELYSFPGRPSAKQKLFALFGLVGATNDPRRARRWERYGLTGVITDYPDLYEK